MNKLSIFYTFCILTLLGTSCSNNTDSHYQRGNDPWVFRSVLDWQPRALTVALDEKFWVAYDANNSRMMKAWKDGVNFDGPVYTSAHGPQPTSNGKAYFEDTNLKPWSIMDGGQLKNIKVQYKGHHFENDQVVVRYEMNYEGKTYAVQETPEYKQGADGPILLRSFTTSGIPEGLELVYDMSLQSIASVPSEDVKGKIDFDGKVARMTLVSNGDSAFSFHFESEPTMVNKALLSVDGDRPQGLKLIERSDCKTCHNDVVKTVGPSYLDIAKKYKSTTANRQMLISKIVKGGSGVWGQQVMTAHPDLMASDAESMVDFILAFDTLETEANAAAMASNQMNSEVVRERQGLVLNVFQWDTVEGFPEYREVDKPIVSMVAPTLHAPNIEDFQGLEENFTIEAKGILHIEKDGNYVFRISSDDGSRLFIDGDLLVDNGGFHGTEAKDAEHWLTAGEHDIHVDYFQGGGGATMSLQWMPHGADNFSVVPPQVLSYRESDKRSTAAFTSSSTGEQERIQLERKVPGDRFPLEEVHPSFTLTQARPDGFEPKVGGMDFLADGRLVISCWDPAGSIYILDNLNQDDHNKIGVNLFASGLAEPLGVKVVDDEIYILQKQELTKLVDTNNDGKADVFETIANGWRVSSNFHEFAFGLEYQDGYFYANLAIAINPGGASTQPQIQDRGKTIKISKETGEIEFITHGLRTPNGIGKGVDGEMFIADNQGDWLPASKILHLKEGAFYNGRAVDYNGTADLKVTPPVVWLPQDEIGNSPSQPTYLKGAPYDGQMIHGEVTHGGIKRVFVEKVNGEYQGVVFRFTQGLESGVNRLAWSPDGRLYIGGVGSTGNWGHYGKKSFGLQRLEYNANCTFEMLNIKARTNGIEIEFTENIHDNYELTAEDFKIQQWWYKPTIDYGGPKMDLESLTIKSVSVNENGSKVFLEIPGIKEGHLVYVNIQGPVVSSLDHELWTTEAWYTMNQIPKNLPGFTNERSLVITKDNQLNSQEIANGWSLLFDGKTVNGWHKFNDNGIGSAWKVENGMLTLNGEKEGWQYKDGGDIVTDEAFENYELSLDWKVEKGGNSGVIFNVEEDPKHKYVWHTGPEMQILDNLHHADGLINKHQAGDLYDLIKSKYTAANASGQWNRAKLKIVNGKAEQWLNGRKVVEYQMWNDNWKALIAGSKFKDMPAFGTIKKGKIALQDHGNRVWFKNVKIRKISDAEIAANAE